MSLERQEAKINTIPLLLWRTKLSWLAFPFSRQPCQKAMSKVMTDIVWNQGAPNWKTNKQQKEKLITTPLGKFPIALTLAWAVSKSDAYLHVVPALALLSRKEVQQFILEPLKYSLNPKPRERWFYNRPSHNQCPTLSHQPYPILSLILLGVTSSPLLANLGPQIIQ